MRQKIGETNASGAITRYGYCDCGALVSVTNAFNTAIQEVTTFEYDYQGNRRYIKRADAYNVTNSFNLLSQLIERADGASDRLFYYNNQGLLVAVSNVFGAEKITLFDVEDRVQSSTDQNGVAVTNAFDLLGRITIRGHPDGGQEKFGYSARGLTVYTNQLTTSYWLYAYDEAGRKTSETNANSEVIQYTNSPAGDLISLTDGKNQTTRWGYDVFGRVTNKVDQAGAEILRYTWDAENRPLSRWSAAKGATYYTNDAVGNLTFINYPSSADASFAYDALNRLTTMVDGVGTTVYTYTAGNQLLTEDGPFASDTVTNTYVNRMRVGLGLAQPAGFWTNGFGFDVARRLTNVTMSAGTFSYAYGASPLPAGTLMPSRIALPNTAYITNTYDSVARLTGTSLRNSAHSTLDYYGYVYNLANQRTQLTRADSSTMDFTFDGIGQLTSADDSVNSYDRSYTYDAAWNLASRANYWTLGGSESFTNDVKNELTGSPEEVFQYDANGNLTERDNFSNVLFRYTYDDENRLTFMEYDDYGTPYYQLHQLVYDGLGRLRQMAEYSWDSGIGDWVLADAKNYIYDGKLVIQERDGDNAPLVSYTRGRDLSGTLQGAGGIGGLVARSDGYDSGSGNWTSNAFYFADGNGNITYLTDSSQNLAAQYRYDPFGHTLSGSGPLVYENSCRFSSKELFGKNLEWYGALYNFGYRFYDPNWQRWLTRDPIEEQGGINLYGFVANDPMRFADQWGLDVDSIHASASNPEAAEILGEVKAEQAALKKLAKDCTKKVGKIADKMKRSNKQIKDAIHSVKHKARLSDNPDVFVDTTTGNVHLETPGGNIGDIIGNILDFLP
jgi:RHS repeat-associated protein